MANDLETTKHTNRTKRHEGASFVERLDEIEIPTGSLDYESVGLRKIADTKTAVIEEPEIHTSAGLFVDLRSECDVITRNKLSIGILPTGK